MSAGQATHKGGQHGLGEGAVHRIAPELLGLAVPVEELQGYHRNPRRGNLEVIRESLRTNGQYRPIVVNRGSLTGRANEILAGNHTWQSARAEAWTHIAATWVDVDDAQAARYVAIDNRANDLAGYDQAALAELLQGLPDLAGTGYSDADLAALLAGGDEPVALTDPDDVPAVGKRTRSIEGDVWLLGPHRLAVGDCTKAGVAEAALGGGHADMVWTDPPYGVSYVGGTGLTIANDDLSSSALGELLDDAFAVAHASLRPGGAFYVCGPSGTLETVFRLALEHARLPLRTQIVWVKDQFVLGRADYHGQHETILYGWRVGDEPLVPPHYEPEHDTILYGWKAGQAHTWQGGRKQSTVWQHARPKRSEDHPTMKPVDLVRRAIENSTLPGQRVLDLFAGSGSAVIAAHHAGRVASVVEMDLRYADVICRRWQEHTGVLPILERTGRVTDFTGDA